MTFAEGYILRGAEPIDQLAYTIEETPLFTNTSESTVTNRDLTVKETTQAGIANNFTIKGNVTKITNQSPLICDVVGNSVLMRITGSAQIDIENNYCKERISRFLTTGSQVTRRFLNFTSGSLRHTIYTQMLDALSVMPTKNYDLQKAVANGVVNPLNFLRSSRGLYIAPPLDTLDEMLASSGGIGWKAWITPHHFLTWLGHGVGDDSDYRQIGGEIVVQYSPTRWNGTLLKLLPTNVDNYAPLNQLALGIPCYGRLRNNYLISDWQNRGEPTVQPATLGNYKNIPSLESYQYRRGYDNTLINGGDSGSPVFTILNGQLIPLTHVAYAGQFGYTPYHQVLNQIQAIVTFFSASGLYQIQTVDLSGFSTFA